MSKTTFVSDLNARVREAERIIADQNENLAALRHLLRIEMGEATPETVAPTKVESAPTHSDVDFKGRTSEIILALVQRSGESGTRPRDIAEVLVQRKLMKKGSNGVHSHLSELKKKGLVQQKAEGIYVASVKAAAAKPGAVEAAPAKKAQKKRRISAAGLEAIRAAQRARWAAAKKVK